MAAMSLPLEISFQLSLWINYVKDKELIDIPYQSQCTVALSNMVDCLGNLERILLTVCRAPQQESIDAIKFSTPSRLRILLEEER
ncbi:hypothetical protein DFQ26_009107 [Actinomortierella ambigua]|nr:hypothetical protein DFQ26_009107 [Actinomortierella ambigua]